MMEEMNIVFFSWAELASCAGALAMVTLITQFTKNWKFLKKIPTQLWSYIVTLLVLYLAYFFTGQLSVENGFLIPFNAVLITLAANGGFQAIKKVLENRVTENTNDIK